MNTISVAEEVSTDRLVLRRCRTDEGFGATAGKRRADVIFAEVDADRERLRRYLPWVDASRKVSDTEAYLGFAEECWEKGTLFDFSIFTKAGEYVGNCGLHTVSMPNRRAELGYWIVGRHEGKGLMTEAIAGVAKAAFAAGFHRLEIRCNAENRKSYGVAERLGFRLDGILREDSIEHGRFRSTRVYGLLAGESSIS